jgi:hypothetical protein
MGVPQFEREGESLDHIAHLARIVLWIGLAVLSIDIAMVAFVFYRRVARQRYYAERDRAKTRFSPITEAFIAGRLAANDAIAAVQELRSSAERDALQQLLLTGMTRTNQSNITDLLVQLGYVRRWTRETFGKRRSRELLDHLMKGRPLPPFRPSWQHRFPTLSSLRLFAVSRALSLIKLGKLSPPYAHLFTLEALHDPSAIVQHMNVSAMGNSRNEQSLVPLLQQLKAAVEGKVDLPVRWIKTALVRYPLNALGPLVPFLKDTHPRVRFLLVDSIREICQREPPENTANLPEQVHDWLLLEAIQDCSSDVRARSAQIIGRLREPVAAQALTRLLRDTNEFVRLHAVRACAAPHHADLLDEVLKRVSDTRWRVREAAVATIASFGSKGRQMLCEYFVASPDRYASEQIADELQRSGVIGEVVLQLSTGEPEASLARKTCSKLVELGKTSFLVEVFGAEHDDSVRSVLMDVLSTVATPQFRSLLESAVADDKDPLRDRAYEVLQSMLPRAATAAGQSA